MITGRSKYFFLIYYFHRTGGTEKHLAQLVCWLASHGFDCNVVVFDLGKTKLIDDMRRAGAVVHTFASSVNTDQGAAQRLQLMRMIRRQRFEHRPDVHQKSDTYGASSRGSPGVRHSSRASATPTRPPALSFFLNRRLRFLFERRSSWPMRRGRGCRVRSLERARLVKIHNGVDSDKFAPAIPRRRRRRGRASDCARRISWWDGCRFPAEKDTVSCSKVPWRPARAFRNLRLL